MSSKPNQKEQMLFREKAALPTPPWAQDCIHTSSCGEQSAQMPLPPFPGSASRGRQRGKGEENHSWLLPIYWPARSLSQSLEMQLGMETGGREAISCPNGPLLLSTPFISLSLSTEKLVNHREPPALLHLCLRLRKTGDQRILNTGPLHLLHLPASVSFPRHA